MTEGEKERIQKLAKIAGYTTAEYMRLVSLGYIQQPKLG
jgi:hypothetical protein